MLLEGPPTTVTVEAPATWKGCVHVGSSTMMGTGCEATIIPQRERASTSWVPLRVISCEKYIFTRSVMSTCMKAQVPVSAVFGVVTPGTLAGKLTLTSFDSTPAVRPGLE